MSRRYESIDDIRLSRRDRTLVERAAYAAAHLKLCSDRLGGALARVEEAAHGHPKAAATDTVRSIGSVLDEYGIPMPSVADPVGEAGIREDRAAEARRQIDGLVNRLWADVGALEAALVHWTGRAPTSIERREAERDNTPICESCARIDGRVAGQPFVNEVRVTVVVANGKGEERRWKVCRWCQDFVRDFGRVPSKNELADYRDGKRRKTIA